MSRFSALIVPTLLVIGWELAVRGQLVPPSHAASPSAVAVRLGELIFSFEIVRHAYHSLFRLLLAVAFGSSLGVLASSCLAFFKTPDRLLSPTVQLLAGIPVVVWIPFGVMFFGTDEAFKIAMVSVSTFFLVYVYNYQSVRSIPRGYLELADMYGKSFLQKVRHIFLPHSTPALFTALRVSLAFGWVVLFFVEYASARHGSEGLGWFIADSRAMGRVESEFAGLLFLGIVAFVLDNVVALIEKRLTRWADTLEALTAEGDAHE